MSNAVNEARSAEKKNNPSRLPSEPAKRLIFSPTIRQRASGTRVRVRRYMKGVQFSVEGIRKRFLFYQKWYMKG